jgi:hypothetical protein
LSAEAIDIVFSYADFSIARPRPGTDSQRSSSPSSEMPILTRNSGHTSEHHSRLITYGKFNPMRKLRIMIRIKKQSSNPLSYEREYAKKCQGWDAANYSKQMGQYQEWRYYWVVPRLGLEEGRADTVQYGSGPLLNL